MKRISEDILKEMDEILNVDNSMYEEFIKTGKTNDGLDSYINSGNLEKLKALKEELIALHKNG